MQNRKTLIISLISAIVIAGLLWFTNRAVTPHTTTWNDVRSEAQTGNYQLISSSEISDLQKNNKQNMVLVDTRQEWEYRTGHIKDALNFPFEPTWWSRWQKKESLESFLGPDKTRLIIFYWAGLTWVRSDSAARVAVKLGYKKVYRDPLGYPDWQKKGLPVETNQTSSVQSAEEPKAPGPLYGWAMIWTLLGIFTGGIALNLTPCVYPLIPITVSYFGGQTITGGKNQVVRIAHGLCYMLGLAITNSILGVIAALTGGLMGALLQNPIVIIVVASFLVIFATSLFDFWEIRLPGFIVNAAAKSYSGYLGSLFMGLMMGIIAAPCIGPFVLGLLTWVASMGSVWLGFLIFFTLSLGLGFPLFFLAVFSGQLQKIPRSGEWMLWVRKLMGWILLAMAAHFLRSVLPESIETFLMAGVAFVAGIHLGWIDKTRGNFKAFQWIRVATGFAGLIFATVLIISWIMRGPGVTWKSYSDEVIESAHTQGKPVIIDFYATWCTPCRELENITFHDENIVRKADKYFVMIKVDVTKGGNPLYERLLRQYEIKGVPTIVFLDTNGKERPDLRLVDYLPPDQFGIRMNNLQK